MHISLLVLGFVLGLLASSARRTTHPRVPTRHPTFTAKVAMRRYSTSSQRQRGQSLVELAIVLPVIVLLVFGSIAAIQIAMANFTVTAAARVAVNQAALIGGADGTTGATATAVSTASGTVAQVIRSTLDGGMATRSTNPAATVTVACATTPCKRYQQITVTVVYPDKVWVPAGPFKEFTARATFVRSSEQDRQTTAGTCGIVGAPPCP